MENESSGLGSIIAGIFIGGTFGLVGLLFLFLGLTFMPVIGLFIGGGLISFGISCGFKAARGTFPPPETEFAVLGPDVAHPELLAVAQSIEGELADHRPLPEIPPAHVLKSVDSKKEQVSIH